MKKKDPNRPTPGVPAVLGVSYLKTIKNCVVRGGLSSGMRGMVATGCISNVNRKMIIIYRGKSITYVIKDVPRC